jgi:hypothetical protein
VTVAQTTLTTLVLVPVFALIAVGFSIKNQYPNETPFKDRAGLLAMQAAIWCAMYAALGGVVLALKAIWA